MLHLPTEQTPLQQERYMRQMVEQLRIDVARLMREKLPQSGWEPFANNPETPTDNNLAYCSGVLLADITALGGSASFDVDNSDDNVTIYSPFVRPVFAVAGLTYGALWNAFRERWELIEAPRSYEGTVPSQIAKGASGTFNVTGLSGKSFSVTAVEGVLRTGKKIFASYDRAQDRWNGHSAEC